MFVLAIIFSQLTYKLAFFVFFLISSFLGFIVIPSSLLSSIILYTIFSYKLSTDSKPPKSVSSSNHLTYFNGQINMTYGKPPGPSVNFIFECDQEKKGSETVPKCESKSDDTYECHWLTPYACRPMISVQCSIRILNGKDDDSQYDYSSLSRSTNNWQAQCTSPFSCDGASYFINVCRTVLLNGGAVRCPPTAGICMVKGYVHKILSLRVAYSEFFCPRQD